MNKTCLGVLTLAIALALAAPLAADAPAGINAFSIVSKSSNYMDIRFELPDYSLQLEVHEGMAFQKIVMENAAYPTGVGVPQLPTLTTLIAIPDQGGARLEVLGSSASVIGNFVPYPVQDEKTAGVFHQNEDYYAGHRENPSQLARCGEPQIMRDLRVVAVEVQPFAWNPASRELTVRRRMTLRLSFSGESGINEFDGTRSISPEFDRIYSGLILNYEQLRNPVVAGTPPRIVMLHGAYSDPSFLNLINEFALWKRQKGADVLVLSTTETGSSNTSIKNYLQGLYDNPQTRFDYLILIGDVSGAFAVPGWSTNGFGDYPYQMLAGSDQLGDVFLGRISAENTAQLNVILAKIYAYEKSMNPATAQWLNRMLLVADTLYDGVSVVNLTHYIRDISSYHNPDYSYTSLVQHAPSPMAMNAALNQGVGIFNYRGYGGMSGWNPSDNNLYNINKVCHSVILTCNTGDYDATGTSELFIRLGTVAAPKGAVTAIGMWGSGTATMPNNALCGAIFDGIFSQGMRTMGEALLHSKLNFARLYAVSNPTLNATFTQWCNLMGDPSMEVYITIPRTFSCDAPAAVASGTDELDLLVTDEDGFPVAQACVTVSHVLPSGTTILGRACTDAAGYAYLPFSAEVGAGQLVLTISKHDFLPLQQTLAVAAGSLLPGSPLIDDDGAGNSSGNGNGIANAGETLELYFSLRNTSPDAVSGVGGYVSCGDPRITILDSLLTFPALASGANAYSSGPVLIQISPGAANGSLLSFTLHLSDAQAHTYTVIDHISITDAELRFDSCQIADGGNAVLDPGETAALNITLLNMGGTTVENLVGELFTANDLVSVTDSLGAFGTVEVAGQASTAADNYTLHARDSLVPGMVIPLRLRLGNAAGFLQWLEFSITIGAVTVNDPLGPDSHGYLIYDDGDLAYDECPSYAWIGIAPVEGGSGTALSISDPDAPGEGDDLSSTSLVSVDLPFSFRFYGQDHQQITVCSNGFIVFGVTENHEFRNYRLPGPLGPSPMVAAFWDDLATGPGSGIYTWFDAANHLFVIEWHQMLNGYDNNYTETFQIILYDPAFYPTSLGDGPIKIQYHTFNNVDSGATNQNHGNFCSIGIESADQLDGLEYSFMNTYPAAASPLGNGRAIYITNMPVYYDNPWLVPRETVINDQNNGWAEPGETIELGVLIDNLGNHTASGVNAAISSNDSCVTIINPGSAYHPIPGHGQGVNLDPFTIMISPDCPHNHSIMFSMDILSSGNAWTHAFTLTVKKPGLSYDSFFLNDLTGNNNGSADPSEAFLLVVNVRNPSEVAVLGLEGQLSSTDANVQIANPLIELPILEGNSISQFVFETSLSASTPLNTTLPLTFSLAAENAPSLSANIALGCGEMGMSEDFEDSNGGFSAQNGWSWGIPAQTQAHSGNKLWGTTLDDQYANGANYMLTSTPVSVGTGAELSFWHQLYCQNNFDGGNVKVSLNGGANWIVISPSSGGTYINTVYSMNEPGFSGNIGVWTRVTFDLSAFADHDILIRWHFTSDGSVTGFGWFIDDVMVTGFAIRSGIISGEVTLSEGGDASLASVTAPLGDATVLARPAPSGAYSIYLPTGTYALAAGMPYHEGASSPVFVITDTSLEYVHDFTLTYLPPVSYFNLAYDSENTVVSLNWTAPEAPAYPVQSYAVYRKIGPGLAESIAQIAETAYAEQQFLTGIYRYFVRPVYAPGEGAPSDTLELEIGSTSSHEDLVPGLENALFQNYPNPFNPSTTISLSLAQAGELRLCIYNLKGQLVRTLARETMPAGRHNLVWDGVDDGGRSVASGVYFYRLETGSFAKTRKMLLVK